MSKTQKTFLAKQLMALANAFLVSMGLFQFQAKKFNLGLYFSAIILFSSCLLLSLAALKGVKWTFSILITTNLFFLLPAA